MVGARRRLVDRRKVVNCAMFQVSTNTLFVPWEGVYGIPINLLSYVGACFPVHCGAFTAREQGCAILT